MDKSKVDYSVYLVTDSTPAILGTKDLAAVVEAAVRGGASIVQYRDKHSDRETAVATARRLLEVTRRFGVPLLVNDRVDVAVEVGCEGVHIGQDDMAYEEARNLLGPNKIIGVTASSVEEALAACKAGADYLGLGTVYATSTKKDTKSIIGPSGIRAILQALSSSGHASIPTVCIGGINARNATAVLLECSAAPAKSLDGIAVVSALVAAEDPAAAARDLLAKVVTGRVPDVLRAVAEGSPLSHNMTNLVVQNFAANVALAVGASPIMANYAEEAADLAKLGGALVVNMGTVTPDGLKNHIQAIQAYNAAGGPVVLDPVGAGATSIRRAAVETLLSSGKFTIIKGNEREIHTISNTLTPSSSSSIIQQRGVDSSSTLSLPQRAALAKSVARSTGAVVVLTGKTDLVSDGVRTLRIDNGHEFLGRVTGTGCTLGTTLSAMVAAFRGNSLLAAVAGLVMYEIAAERAGVRDDVRGPGTFVPAFLDELSAVREETVRGDVKWLAGAKVEAVEVDEE
ncbi:Hydroxyethylthiazole kinase family domain-containing protein [Trichoderma longibrachiatum]|uniref:TMP-TENI-domain-containing protein n=1 Tax=Trichoderma longibrachiatum ATCC 18648 TaxID=983965 RepID=A0A2T4CI20_TRILO|nr:TMP-TENI-domain-containing protein [Trichoderma longibrachiatum ATCC 18648]